MGWEYAPIQVPDGTVRWVAWGAPVAAASPEDVPSGCTRTLIEGVHSTVGVDGGRSAARTTSHAMVVIGASGPVVSRTDPPPVPAGDGRWHGAAGRAVEECWMTWVWDPPGDMMVVMITLS